MIATVMIIIANSLPQSAPTSARHKFEKPVQRLYGRTIAGPASIPCARPQGTRRQYGRLAGRYIQDATGARTRQRLQQRQGQHDDHDRWNSPRTYPKRRGNMQQRREGHIGEAWRRITGTSEPVERLHGRLAGSVPDSPSWYRFSALSDGIYRHDPDGER